jgi:hypothetical protein
MMRKLALTLWALLGVVGPVHAEDNKAGRGALADCRPAWIEPDAYTRKLPVCTGQDNKETPAQAPRKSAGASNEADAPSRLPGYPNRSCWAAPAECLHTTTAWGKSELDRESKRFHTYNKNACAHRIFVRACIEREGLKPYCGASGIEPGKTWHWSVSKSTGRYRALHVGVIAGKDDFVCPKPSGWKELGK